MQAMTALTGGNPVNAVAQTGSVAWTVGNNQGIGSITLQSSGYTESQFQISTSGGNFSESRSWASDGSGPIGQWSGLNGQPHQMAQHNCWTDAVWFFPALSLLSDYSDPTMVYNDLGQEQFDGQTVEHIQAYRYISSLPSGPQQLLQQLSTVDYYLQSQTALPVAMGFFIHGDKDIGANIPVQITFAQYQAVSGIQVPQQVTKSIAGSPVLQITVSSTTF